jgi:hypothetical protein
MRQNVRIVQLVRRMASNKIRYKFTELLEMNEIYSKSRGGSADFDDLIEICIFKLQGVETTRQSVSIIQPSRRSYNFKIRYKINELLDMNEIYSKSRGGSAKFNDVIKICIFKLLGVARCVKVSQLFSQVDERLTLNKIRYKISELSQANEIYVKCSAKSAEFNDLIKISIFKLQGLETAFQNVPISRSRTPNSVPVNLHRTSLYTEMTGITSALTGPDRSRRPGVNGAAVNQRRQIANSSRRADHRRRLIIDAAPLKSTKMNVRPVRPFSKSRQVPQRCQLNQIFKI